MSKMKIAIFFTYDYTVDTLKNSGLFDREMRIYDEIAKKYEVSFIFFTYDQELDSKDFGYKDFEFFPIYKYTKKFNNKILRLISSFLIPFKINKKLNNINLLHQHQILGSWIPLILKYKLNIPLLVRTGYDAYSFSIDNNDRKFKILFYKLLTKLTLRFCDLYTVTSHSDINFLKKYFPINNVKVVPNWIDRVPYTLKQREEAKILMIGRLEYQKNYPLAFEFLKNLNSSYELDIYGLGSNKEYLEQLSKNYDIKVNFLGNISHSDLIKTYRKYKYFLSTSRFEGNPKTILEAINSKCIVFATDISNHSEIISDGFNGVLYKTPEDLIKKFNIIRSNSEIQDSIVNNCDTSLENNQIEKVVETMYIDYESLMSFK